MNTRDTVLRRIRHALRDVPAEESPADIDVARPARERATGDPDLFAERVADYRATVIRCAAREVRSRLAETLPHGARLLIPADLPAELRPDEAELIEDRSLPITELDAVRGVLTTARLGVAETGTIVLDHGPGQGRRAATLVPDLHICLVRTDHIVPDVTEAIHQLDPARPQTWISGPSATSDIELDRVEGVHGPRQLIVLLIS